MGRGAPWGDDCQDRRTRADVELDRFGLHRVDAARRGRAGEGPPGHHVAARAELEAFGAELKWNRVVDDGTLVTAGGITSGIDLALHVVEREYGVDVADGIGATMEYTRDRDVYVSN